MSGEAGNVSYADSDGRERSFLMHFRMRVVLIPGRVSGSTDSTFLAFGGCCCMMMHALSGSSHSPRCEHLYTCVLCILYTTLLSQWEFIPWEIRVAFPKESQLQQTSQSRYRTVMNYKAHAGGFRVSIINPPGELSHELHDL